MSNTTKVLVCNTSRMHAEPLLDRIEAQISTDVTYCENAERALELVPTKGPCIIVTESIIPSAQNLGPSNTEGTLWLLKESKKKNPACKVILYSVYLADISSEDLKGFDYHDNSMRESSYQALFNKLRSMTGVTA